MRTDSPHVVIIIQARMGSTRLPAKVLKQVAGIPLLALQLKRVAACRQVSNVVVAIPEGELDTPLAHFCKEQRVVCYRGSEADVLARFWQAASQERADLLVRLTGDCPLSDPTLIDTMVSEFLDAKGEVDYLSNALKRSFPRGLDVEVFSFDALDAAYHKALDPQDREHVTPYIYRHPEQFRLRDFVHQQDCSQHRWTVDTPEDFLLIEKILSHFLPQKPLFSWTEALELLGNHPEWSRVNAHVEQKKLKPTAG